MKLLSDVRNIINNKPLSLHRQTFLKTKRLNRTSRRWRLLDDRLYSESHTIGQLALIAPLLAQVTITRLTSHIFEITPREITPRMCTGEPFIYDSFIEQHPQVREDIYTETDPKPREWATGDVNRVREDIDFTLLQTFSTWGKTLDNHVVVIYSRMGVSLGIGGLRQLHIPECEYCGDYVPIIQAMLKTFVGDREVDILGITHILAACVWYITTAKDNYHRMRLFGFPQLVGGVGNAYIGDWINVRVRQIPNNQTHMASHSPRDNVQAISANKNMVMSDYLDIRNTHTKQTMVNKAYSVIEQIKRDLGEDDS